MAGVQGSLSPNQTNSCAEMEQKALGQPKNCPSTGQELGAGLLRVAWAKRPGIVGAEVPGRRAADEDRQDVAWPGHVSGQWDVEHACMQNHFKA